MVDWLISLLVVMRDVLFEGGLITWVISWTVALPAVVLIHELGHAAAARARGLRLEMIAVGDRDDALLRIGRTVLRFGRPERGDWSALTMTVAIVIFVGVGYLIGAHRRKIF